MEGFRHPKVSRCWTLKQSWKYGDAPFIVKENNKMQKLHAHTFSYFRIEI